eukprot:TRINITY_DN14197_c0_g1_i1.p1 TRINITY_DN14197_c0_g1~~TRINITY_DN14197_c0_g1_i1.p1  ORF type:complete len:277 (+),score=38.99 TRINITY_DN14197_c0_g1_i1:59-889(+)
MCIRDRGQRQINLRSHEAAAYAAYRKHNLLYGMNVEECMIDDVDMKRRILTFSCRAKDVTFVRNKLEERVLLHVRTFEYPRGSRGELEAELRHKFSPYIRLYRGKTLGLNPQQNYLFAEERNKESLNEAMVFIEAYQPKIQRRREERMTNKKNDESVTEEEKDGGSTTDMRSVDSSAVLIGERIEGGSDGKVSGEPKSREERRFPIKSGSKLPQEEQLKGVRCRPGRISAWIPPPGEAQVSPCMMVRYLHSWMVRSLYVTMHIFNIRSLILSLIHI